MAQTVYENIVGFDIAVVSALTATERKEGEMYRWIKPRLWTASMARIHSAI